MARLFFLFVLLALVGVVVVLACQNAGPVNVQFLGWEGSAALSAVGGAVYLLGVLSGGALVALFRAHHRLTAERGNGR